MVKKLSGWVLAAGAGALLVACATEGSGGSYASFDPAQERAGNTGTERPRNNATERSGNTATERAPNYTEAACSSGTFIDVAGVLDSVCEVFESCFGDLTSREPEFEERRVSAWDAYLAVKGAMPLMRHQDDSEMGFCDFTSACSADPQCASIEVPFCIEDYVTCIRAVLDLIRCDGSGIQELTEADVPDACERVMQGIDVAEE